jgi:hypothetical protein
MMVHDELSGIDPSLLTPTLNEMTTKVHVWFQAQLKCVYRPSTDLQNIHNHQIPARMGHEFSTNDLGFHTIEYKRC